MHWPKSNAPLAEPNGAKIDSERGTTQFDDSENTLRCEFAQDAAKAAQPETVEWLARYGIGRDIIFELHCSPIGTARIEADGDYYQPTREGRPAVTIPVSYDYALGYLDPIDIVAFEPARPERWYRRTGLGDVLGEDAIERAWHFKTSLQMHGGPLNWLQAGAHGCCFLDWQAVRFALDNVRVFNCPSRDYGMKLQRALSEPAQAAGVSERTIERTVRMRLLPRPLKLGRTILFHVPTVQQHFGQAV